MNTPTITPVTGPLAAPVAATDFDALLVHMVYRTEEGREATVVFGGSEDDFDSELRPFRHEMFGVRVAYDLGGDRRDYGWYTGTLTPLHWLSAPVRVMFKDEGDLDGQTVGPMRMVFDGEDAHGARPYKADRPRAPWVFRDHAVQVAESLGLTLTES